MSLRYELTKELTERLETDIPFQLIPRTFSVRNYEKKAYALNIECAIEDARHLSNKFCETFSKITSDYVFQETKKVMFVPLRSTKELSEPLIKNCINEQIDYVNKIRRILVDPKLDPEQMIKVDDYPVRIPFIEMIQRNIPSIDSITKGREKSTLYPIRNRREFN